MDLTAAKFSLDKIIKKSRVHLYKPIQIAEILYRNRVYGDIDLQNLESYRNPSKKWRDNICLQFIGRVSTSSQKYQDDLFNDHATPPNVINTLGIENNKKNGIVEAYIYRHLQKKHSQMVSGLGYCSNTVPSDFDLKVFLNLFWKNPGLKRSIDKIYEIVVYSLFSVLVDELNIQVTVSLDESKIDLLQEFEDFAKKVICVSVENPSFTTPARLYRVGVTNAADRGLDMWANFGPAIQIKHLALEESLAENIVESVTADRIIIVCRSSEKRLILSLVNQLGWKSRIQSVITEDDLMNWYEKALRGKYSRALGKNLIQSLCNEITVEFPSSQDINLLRFFQERGYNKISDNYWKVRE